MNSGMRSRLPALKASVAARTTSMGLSGGRWSLCMAALAPLCDKRDLLMPRADARRHRERLLIAVKDPFAVSGAEASLDGIARRAGLGSGTLYRHFPTREALMRAV